MHNLTSSLHAPSTPLHFSAWIYSIGQASPFDDSPAPAAAPEPANRPMSFSDLQHGMRAYQSGEIKDNGFRNGLLALLAIVAVVALILHFRQRHKSAGPPDSLARLARELARHVHFPFGTRFMLFWVGRSTKTPFASLLLSAALFDKAVADWAKNPTFGAARHWGRTRLLRLRAQLFT